MKVVIPVGALHVGGGCSVLAQVANALVRYGHDTEIIIPKNAPIAYQLDCKVTKVKELTPEVIPFGDIVLPNFYTTFKPAFEAWPNQCVRYSLGFEPSWVPDTEYALWTYAQGVPTISISHWIDNQIYNHIGMRTSVVNLGVNPDNFHPKRSTHENARRHEQHKRGRKIILYIARDPEAGYALKGFHDFVRAMKRLKKTYNGNFIVYMVCPERELPLPGILHRTFKARDEAGMGRLYRQADVFVSTSWVEGFALPPLEAMACGTPVVSTNSGGVLDFEMHKKNAYITNPKDYRRIAHGIKKILIDKNFARRLRHEGVRTASMMTSEWFLSNMVHTLESIHAGRISAH